MTKLEKRRKELGLSRRMLAEAIGSYPVTIFRYEKKMREPTLKYALMLSNVLGMPVEELLQTA